MPRRHPIDADRGDTLLELLVAITILGVCVVAIASGIAGSVRISAIHRSQATAGDWLHLSAEYLQSQYMPCTAGSPMSYASKLSPPLGYVSPATAPVMFWDDANGTFDLSNCPVADPGLQQVHLTLTSTGGQVAESLTVVLRSQS
jgi:prepilin-type N-terminal cleavage/methylation domain-containing protein